METQTAYIAPKNKPQMTEREAILQNLAAFAAQRPGLEYGNYNDPAAYRAEMRSITKDLHHARALLAAVSWRESITAEVLRESFRAFSGRLQWNPKARTLDYCTGQYWPTEYRRAVCAVLASALWSYWRENMPAPDGKDSYGSPLYKGKTAGDVLRTTARKEMGAAIARRWFN